ncbi:hypothetical protein [Streptomyces sp. SAS_260]|uniref:hypothetical protein n=1 Tax=Streptomyces sp. SAS_260 TaxID=3412751 RepID=UPI00403CD5E6
MRAFTKKLLQGTVAAALAFGGVTVASGSASAAADSACGHSTCITGWNLLGELDPVEMTICNYQSAANDFVLSMRENQDGQVFATYTTPLIPSGHCLSPNWTSYRPYPTTAVQFSARSGSNWSYSTGWVGVG